MTIIEETGIGGQLVGAHDHLAKRFPAGRICEQDGCETRLSVYNSRSRCSEHDFDVELVHVHVHRAIHAAKVSGGGTALDSWHTAA